MFNPKATLSIRVASALFLGILWVLIFAFGNHAGAMERPKTREMRVNIDWQTPPPSRWDIFGLKKIDLSPNIRRIHLDTEANVFGLRWTSTSNNSSQNDAFFFELRTRQGQNWSPWSPLPMMGRAESKDGDPTLEMISAPVFFRPSATVELRVTPLPDALGQMQTLKNVELIALNSTIRSSSFARFFSSTKTVAQTTIIPREQWGADESYRYRGNGAEWWPIKSTTVKKFILHHTAGGDGGDDPAATVRGIYYWHAVVLGWGDIGYNFLVDHLGNVYEGRVGGDGVVGGHTFDSSSNTNFNEESMGVAVLGCYESTTKADGTGNCPTVSVVTENITNTLASLFADKATLHGIDPLGENEWSGVIRPNILGHRDVDHTLCPGDQLYANVELLRTQTAEAIAQIPAPRWEAKRISHSIAPSLAIDDRLAAAEIVFQNTGNQTWKRSELRLTIQDIDDRPSKFRNRKWSDDFGQIKMREIEVKPEGSATFRLTFATPEVPGFYRNIFQLQHGKNIIDRSRFSAVTRVKAQWRAAIASDNIPLVMRVGWNLPVTVKLKNIGTEPWFHSLKLRAYDVDKSLSPFRADDWKSPTLATQLVEGRVDPGEIGTFAFTLEAPNEPGLYQQTFRLVDKRKPAIYIHNQTFTRLTRVDP